MKATKTPKKPAIILLDNSDIANTNIPYAEYILNKSRNKIDAAAKGVKFLIISSLGFKLKLNPLNLYPFAKLEIISSQYVNMSTDE